MGLLTEHCDFKEHTFKLGPIYSPTCKRCQNKDETASHILYECETSQLGISLHKTNRLLKDPTKQSFALHLKCGTARGLTKKGVHNRLKNGCSIQAGIAHPSTNQYPCIKLIHMSLCRGVKLCQGIYLDKWKNNSVWRKFHNKDLINLYPLHQIPQWSGYQSCFVLWRS
jgi:hypothetical protein